MRHLFSMFDAAKISYQDRTEFYRQLSMETGGILSRAWFSNLSNVSALLMQHLPDINWAGFYLARGEKLYLGPFQGLPACLEIDFGRGVCGASARDRRSLVVADVHTFPGYIACDARSRSEIVVPLILGSRVLGVLDVDSPEVSRFDDLDRAGLEGLCSVLLAGTDWPAGFCL